MHQPLAVSAIDYHTAGEPFRIVSGGVPPLKGTTVLERRRDAAARLDHVRQLLISEPRGHADMYGCFVTEPDDESGDLGVVFFHNAGYSTACGHGTIALVTWALDSGVVPVTGPETPVVVDAPSGRLRAIATVEGGRVRSVRFANVPSFVEAAGVEVTLPAGAVRVDLAFGGAFYAVLDASAVGCAVVPDDLPALIAHGRAIKAAVESTREVVHPEIPDVRDVYGVIFVDGTRAEDGGLHQRNVAIFADGEVDRSPTGSGVSARLALLDASGVLRRGATLVTSGMAGPAFLGRVTGDADVAGRPGVATEVEGTAFRTGHHEFVLDPDDPLGTGFLLR
ncbi:MAG: proline racemase [Nitriliruptorales bacterium]|nr:proline racemase [Nitriliruptorales bacterium]